MNAKDAAKRHREQAEHLSAIAEMRAKDGNHVHACAWRDAAEYHALAARVLDALAVIGPEILNAASRARSVVDAFKLIDGTDGILELEITDAQRTALRTLRDAAKGTP